MDEDNLIDFIKSKYKVKKDKDGSYLVIADGKAYVFKENNEYLFEGPSRSGGIGEDDLMPNFDNKIRERFTFKGTSPTVEELEDIVMNSKKKDVKSMKNNPLAKFDPLSPNRKNKKDPNEPDPDNFQPRSLHDYF